jgi:hypothetical protein
MMGLLLSVIIVYLLFFWDFEITLKTRKNTNKITYFGLLWVILDRMCVEDTDIPRKWLTNKREKRH